MSGAWTKPRAPRPPAAGQGKAAGGDAGQGEREPEEEQGEAARQDPLARLPRLEEGEPRAEKAMAMGTSQPRRASRTGAASSAGGTTQGARRGGQGAEGVEAVEEEEGRSAGGEERGHLAEAGPRPQRGAPQRGAPEQGQSGQSPPEGQRAGEDEQQAQRRGQRGAWRNEGPAVWPSTRSRRPPP